MTVPMARRWTGSEVFSAVKARTGVACLPLRERNGLLLDLGGSVRKPKYHTAPPKSSSVTV